jgi:hypothetical protein
LKRSLVDLEARLDEEKVRTLSFGRHRRRGRSDAELTGLVAGGRHDAALAGSADSDRLAAKVRCRFEFDLSLFCSIGVGPRYFLISSVSNRSNPFSGRGPDDVEIDIVVPVSHDVR